MHCSYFLTFQHFHIKFNSFLCFCMCPFYRHEELKNHPKALENIKTPKLNIKGTFMNRQSSEKSNSIIFPYILFLSKITEHLLFSPLSSVKSKVQQQLGFSLGWNLGKTLKNQLHTPFMSRDAQKSGWNIQQIKFTLTVIYHKDILNLYI